MKDELPKRDRKKAAEYMERRRKRDRVMGWEIGGGERTREDGVKVAAPDPNHPERWQSNR